MMTYSINDCAVLHLDAGNDANGGPRRVYVLLHAPTGAVLATADEGHDGTGALAELLTGFRLPLGALSTMLAWLRNRATSRIRIAPSYRTHLLREERKARLECQVHGKPELTA